MNNEIVITLDTDFVPKKIKTQCVKCNTEFKLIHQEMGRYKGECSKCGQKYRASKRKLTMRR